MGLKIVAKEGSEQCLDKASVPRARLWYHSSFACSSGGATRANVLCVRTGLRIIYIPMEIVYIRPE